jgi:hypothetical protein
MKYLKEFNGMGSNYYTEYPYQYNTIDNPTDRGKDGNLEHYRKVNNFQRIQNELVKIIMDKKSLDLLDSEKVMYKFFELGNDKNKNIRNISDRCKNSKKCAEEIYKSFIKYVEIQSGENISENYVNNEFKMGGKYTFFMFLLVIDELKNSFVKEDYLNIKDFNLFFTTDHIKNKTNLINLLQYKKTLEYGYDTFIKLKQHRLSFYFGIKDYILEYGFHDDMKRIIWKIGEFKMTNVFLKNLSSYKSIVLISKILNNINLKELILLQKIKTDIKELFGINTGQCLIEDELRVVKKINNIELLNYYRDNKISDYFNNWCSNFKWFYNTYNYVFTDEDNTYFYVKLKKSDSGLNYLNKKLSIKYLSEDKEVLRSEIYEPLNREPLNSDKPDVREKPKGKKLPNNKNDFLKKYYVDLNKVLEKIKKEKDKNNSYLSKFLYPIVDKYQKKFNDVKKDLQWLIYKLNKNPNFIEDYVEKNNKKTK